MASRSRTPNLALAGLMREGEIKNAQLARAVNRVGAELGVILHYDKTSVSHWLKGSVPKPQARPAVAEALSRLSGGPSRLRRPGSASPASRSNRRTRPLGWRM